MNRCRVTGGMRDQAGVAPTDVAQVQRGQSGDASLHLGSQDGTAWGGPPAEEGGLWDFWGPQVRLSWIDTTACVYTRALKNYRFQPFFLPFS